MVFVQTWDETTPPGTESISLGDNRIRDFKYAIRERLAEEHAFYADETGKTDVGMHNKVTLLQRGSDPAFRADAAILYSKEVATKAEIFNMFETNNAYQWSYLGKLWIEALKIASETDKDLIRFNGTKWTRYAWATLLTDLTTDLGSGSKNSYSNLKVIRISATQVQVTADELTLVNASGEKKNHTSVNVTGDITVSGANGLDAGAEAINTWYAVWVISDGTTPAALLSTSFSAPTMPVGYTYKALVGSMRNDASGDFVGLKQYGDDVWYDEWPIAASGNVTLVGWTAVDLTAFVPSNLSEVVRYSIPAYGSNTGVVGITNDNTVENLNQGVPGGTGNPTRNRLACYSTDEGDVSGEINILTANTVYWASNAAQAKFFISGYKITKI